MISVAAGLLSLFIIIFLFCLICNFIHTSPFFVFLLHILLLVCSLKNISHLSSKLTLVKTNLLEDVTNKEATNKEATNNNYTDINLKYNNYSSNNNNTIYFVHHPLNSYGLSIHFK